MPQHQITTDREGAIFTSAQKGAQALMQAFNILRIGITV